MYSFHLHQNPFKKISTFIFIDFLLIILNQIHTSCSSDFLTFEDEIASEFRDLVKGMLHKDYMKSEGYLLRWLRVHDFDIDVTLDKFKQSLEWRKKHNIDHILRENFTSIDEAYPYVLEGVDKDGRPVAWAPIGMYNVRKIVIAGEQDLYQRYMIRMFELIETYLHQMRQHTGHDNITQVVVIFDMGGFNVKTGACLHCLGMIPEFMSNVEHNYPNIFFKAYHINTPGLFNNVFSVAKNFMSGQTKEALQIFDYDKDKWSQALLKQIPSDQLPKQYGGTKPFDYYTISSNRNQIVAKILAESQQDELKSLQAKDDEQEMEFDLQSDHNVNIVQHHHKDDGIDVFANNDIIESEHDIILETSNTEQETKNVFDSNLFDDSKGSELPHLRHHRHNHGHGHHHHHHYQELQPTTAEEEILSKEPSSKIYNSQRLHHRNLRNNAQSNIQICNYYYYSSFLVSILILFVHSCHNILFV